VTIVPDQFDALARLFADFAGLIVSVNVPSSLISRTQSASSVEKKALTQLKDPCHVPLSSLAGARAAETGPEGNPAPGPAQPVTVATDTARTATNACFVMNLPYFLNADCGHSGALLNVPQDLDRAGTSEREPQCHPSREICDVR
jgi:hypothetical protein